MTMATLKSPYGKGVITVSDDQADRYKAAGWVEEAPKRSTRKTASSKGDEK